MRRGRGGPGAVILAARGLPCPSSIAHDQRDMAAEKDDAQGSSPSEDVPMVDVGLGRIVIREGSEQQFIYLRELAGERGFPIVIGTPEACEIRRVVHGIQSERPLTHQLAFTLVQALGARLARVDIVDLKNN